MTDYLADALELLHQPAALFECEGLRFVAANASASAHADTLDDPEVQELRRQMRAGVSGGGQLLAHFGFDSEKARTMACGDKGYYAKELPIGVVYMSKMPTSPLLTRPDLLLLTLHPRTSRDAAYMAHYRMMTVLRINEEGERSIRMMEDALVQLQAVVSAQHEMLRETNHRAADFFRLQVGNLREPLDKHPEA